MLQVIPRHGRCCSTTSSARTGRPIASQRGAAATGRVARWSSGLTMLRIALWINDTDGVILVDQRCGRRNSSGLTILTA